MPSDGARTAPHDQQHPNNPHPDANQLQIRLLGGFQVSVNGHGVDERAWGRRKAAALVKLLALAPRYRMHREQIIEALWPESDPETAGANLRVVLHAARRALHVDTPEQLFLQPIDDEIVLQLNGIPWVDVEAFERGAGAAGRSGDLNAYRDTLALYGGELLPGDRYEDWTVSRRERLHELYLSTLTGYAAAVEQTGDLPATIAALEQIIAVDPTHEVAATRLMDAYARSGQRSRALRMFRQLRDALDRELDAAPDEETRRLYGEILASRGEPGGQAATRRATAPNTNIRAPLTRFIGREEQLRHVTGALAEARLVSLTGAGGSGKTRLALAVAQSVSDDFPDGAWLVDLSPLGSAEAIPGAIAAALQLRLDPALDETSALIAAIDNRSLLLVLDNCEHLIEACARMAEMLLQGCTQLRILATSREPLRVAGELLLRVPALQLPDATQPALPEIAASESVRLFCDRARFARPDFVLSEDNAATVAAICRRLDGLPLAIELAAVRVAMFSVRQLADRLSDPLQLLTGGSRTTEPRQQTLRATLDWSFGLLAPPEQRLLARLSVFAGGWTLDAAEAVCSGDGVERRDVLSLLAGLVDKSLVEVRAGASEARYRLLETVRQYATEQWASPDERDATFERHANHFLMLAEESEAGLLGSEQEFWLELLDRELDNLRAALSWLEQTGDVERRLRIGAATVRMWWIRGYVIEGRRWLESGLDDEHGQADIDPQVRARALQAAGNLARLQGDAVAAERHLEGCLEIQRRHGSDLDVAYALNYLAALLRLRDDVPRAMQLAQDSLALFRQTGDERGISLALGTLGELTYAVGDAASSAEYLEEALQYVERQGDIHSIAITLNNLGEALRAQERFEQASARFEAGLALFRELEATHGVAYLLANLGDVARAQGKPARALAYCQEAIQLFHQIGYQEALLGVVGSLAALDARYGEPERAARLFGAEAALRDAIGVPLVASMRADYDQAIAAVRTRLTNESFDAAWQRGARMPLDELIALTGAVEVQPRETAAGPSLDGLSDRERDVALRVARRMTNRQIAAELGLSVRTVDTHVGNILRKLGLPSRQELANRVAGTPEHPS